MTVKELLLLTLESTDCIRKELKSLRKDVDRLRAKQVLPSSQNFVTIDNLKTAGLCLEKRSCILWRCGSAEKKVFLFPEKNG